MRHRLFLPFATSGALLAACVGHIGDDVPPAPGDLPGDDDELEAPSCDDVGPRMIRRLTNLQLEATLTDLFGPEVPFTEVLTDPVIHGFKIDATAAVIRDLNAQQLMVQAETVAAWAADTQLGTISPCQDHVAPCYRQFVEEFGRRAYRRDVPPTSVDAYVALALEETGFVDGARAVLTTMLQSPFLLYRHERGAPDPEAPGTFVLTSDEVADNLAFTLTDAPPDDVLREAAAAGRLDTPEDLERETRRLVQSSAADGRLARFVDGWLEIDDLLTRNKLDPTDQYRDDIARSMKRETETFYRHVVRDGGTFADLLNADYTFVDGPLAAYYGFGGGGDATPVQTPVGDQRPRGLLGHGAFLARHALADSSSPVQRGVIVQERFLCSELPLPPPSVDTDIAEPTEPTTTRARYLAHLTTPGCASCHRRIDPIGFAFEHYDAFGRYRDQENGYPIDATGELVVVGGGDAVAVDGLDELSAALADESVAQACFRSYSAYYAYGLEGCNPEAIEALSGDGASLEDLWVAIVQAPHFTHRR
ncbi:MAG: DUF1592 domain-containing protein [Myxococcota bacterium]